MSTYVITAALAAAFADRFPGLTRMRSGRGIQWVPQSARRKVRNWNRSVYRLSAGRVERVER